MSKKMKDPADAASDYKRDKQEPAAACEPTDTQRFRLSVPKLKTAITMGEGAKDGQLYRLDVNERLHFPGFGVTTEGHLFLEARGPRETSRIKLQTQGDISIHSNESSVNVGGRTAVAVGTDGSASMVGKSGVLIAGGWLGLDTVNVGLQEPRRNHHPATPGWIDDFNMVTQIVGSMFQLFDLTRSGMKARQRRLQGLLEFQELKEEDHRKLKKAYRRLGVFGAATSALGSLYSVARSSSTDYEPPKLLEQALAGTSIIGHAGVTIASPGTTSVSSMMGVTIYSPTTVGIDAGELLEIGSGRGIIVTSERSMEVVAKKNLVLVGTEVAEIGSDSRLTLAAEDEIHIKMPGMETYMFGGDIFQTLEGERSTLAASQLITGTESVVVDGTESLSLVSSNGDATLNAQNGAVGIGGKDGVRVHCKDAWMNVEADSIALTVGNGEAESKLESLKAYTRAIDRVKRNWSAANERGDRDAIKELEKQRGELESKRVKAAMDYVSALKDHSPNKKDGIQISSSKVVVAVGGDELTVKKGKVEVLKSFKVT